ncbi:acyl-CoA thioesterase [Thalassovita sp.]|uniref:acyl-CoA thioesterase n=1 Tax=Thalassovita sp. TaxID=1979401 RepID=UPI002B27126A|nr:acyl-CoA thioesterase [Thalassovita sp.]
MPGAQSFAIEVQISFGHCDAAGIVFYPNYFRWLDRCFHTFLLHRHGGHAALCERLGARGIGLMSADAKFLSPGHDGDLISVEMAAPNWRERSFTLPYQVRIGDRVLLKGEEVRGLFGDRDGRMTALPVTPLRDILEAVKSG